MHTRYCVEAVALLLLALLSVQAAPAHGSTLDSPGNNSTTVSNVTLALVGQVIHTQDQKQRDDHHS